MADPQQNTDRKSPSRARKLAGMVGEALTVRSPILSQLKETAESITEKPKQGKSRLGNVLGSIQQAAVNRSPIIRNFLMMKDALSSVLKKDNPQDGDQKYGKATEKKSETQKDQKTSQGTDNTVAIVEYLKNLENPYYVVMKSDNNYLKDIVDLLKQQSQIMRDTLQMSKESQERSTTQKALESVSRSDAARARAAQQPGDERGRFTRQEDVAPGAGASGLAETLDAVDDAFDIVKSLKRYGGVIAGGFAAATATFARYKNAIVSRLTVLGRTLRGFAEGLRPLTRSFASTMGSLVDDAGRAASRALPSVRAAAGRGLGLAGRGLGLAARAVGGVTFGAAMGILDPSDLGDGTPEGTVRRNYADELRAMGFDPETGEAESPEAEARARAFIDEKVQTGQLVPERGLPPEQQAAAEANAQRLREMGYDPDTGEPLTDEARETVERLRREREERDQTERRLRTTREPPDLTPPAIVAPTTPMSITPSDAQEIQEYLNSLSAPAPTTAPQIVGSAPISRMQGYLSAMNGFMMPQAAAPQAQPSTPVIVNNQGGPTSINNGGNVTNIITGGSSLTLPQLAFNLPSSIS